ncbi:(2Fe-2S)-binding protein [Streptomyces calidiresistens]
MNEHRSRRPDEPTGDRFEGPQQHPGHPEYPGLPLPRTGWGVEYDSEATAHIQLPPAVPDTDTSADPLAAPGGQDFRPPEIGTEPVLPGPETDPGAPGRWASWTMPFGADAAPAPAGPDAALRPTGTGPAGPAEAPTAFAGGPPPPGPAAGSAAAMGQGAAAALAGVTRGRTDTGRRPGPDDPGAPGVPSTGAPGGDGAGDAPGDDGGTVGEAWSAPPGGPAGPAGPQPPSAVSASGGPPATDPGPRPDPHPDPDATGGSDHPVVSYVLGVNGVDRAVEGSWIGESLLYVLRERLGLAGAKDGCSQGECGACSVQLDGRLVAACLVPAATAAGCGITTVEGLIEHDGSPSDVQRALARTDVQCGFCLPGMAMTVHDLLEGNHAPTELETRQALCGNLCRCSGYRGVLDAVQELVDERAARTAELEAEADRRAADEWETDPGAAPGAHRTDPNTPGGEA